MIGVSRITLHRRIRELGLEEETRYSEIDDQELMQNFEGITKIVKVSLKKPYEIFDKKNIGLINEDSIKH